MAGKTVAGELYESITGQLFEIGRQLRQPNGYPFNPELLKKWLQMAIEGKFVIYPPHPLELKPFDPNLLFEWNGKITLQKSHPLAADLAEFDSSNIVFHNPPGPNGAEYNTYCLQENMIALDARAFQALWNEEDHASLEFLRLNRGIRAMTFIGSTVLDRFNDPFYLTLLYRKQKNIWEPYRWYDFMGCPHPIPCVQKSAD